MKPELSAATLDEHPELCLVPTTKAEVEQILNWFHSVTNWDPRLLDDEDYALAKKLCLKVYGKIPWWWPKEAEETEEE